MIRFACPRCKTILERPDVEAGTKFSCPGCQQRLQVPLPPENKTVIGSLVTPALGIQAKAMPVALPPQPPPILAEPRPVSTMPRAKDAWDFRDEDEGRRPRRRDRYDDDDDLSRPHRRSAYAEEDCIRGANVGFLCSMISLGLVFAAMIIWLVLIAEQARPRDANPFIFIILAIGLASFVMGLIGTIFSSRGLDQINTRNRGLAITGLICGILGMVIGLIGSAVFFCIGMFFLALPWR